MYHAWAPNANKDYVSQIGCSQRGRKLKHKGDLVDSRVRGLDRCHKVFKQLGFVYFFFVAIPDMDKIGNKLFWNELQYEEFFCLF